MCDSIVWLAKKIWIIVGVLLYFFDIGSDFSLMVKLFMNCHYMYAIASILIISLAFVITWLKGYKGQRDILFMKHYLYFKWITLRYGDYAIDDYQKRFLDRVKVYEAMLESLPQIGLSFYIMNHHGLDEPAITNIKGDIQIFSLVGSIVSVSGSFFNRHAWMKFKKDDGTPEILDIVKAALQNFIPLNCFLVAFFIITGSYQLFFGYIGLLMTQMILVFAMNLCSCKLFDFYSINRFLITNTLIIAIFHTIQIFAIGIDGNEALLERPFNNCLNATSMSGLEDNLNTVFTHSTEFLLSIWILVVIGFIHVIIECFCPPRYKNVNFWTFMFSKLYFK